MSLARRLISAGLPAPSMTTWSNSAMRPLERGLDDRPQARAALEPGQRGRGRVVAAHDDHLAVRLRAWFQEHRVHAHLGRGARRERLDVLRAPDLEPVGRHGGVGAHVLGLERRHPQAPIGEIAAQRGRQQRLASVARAAHDHDRSPRHGSPLLGPSTVWAVRRWGKPSSKRRRARTTRRPKRAPRPLLPPARGKAARRGGAAAAARGRRPGGGGEPAPPGGARPGGGQSPPLSRGRVSFPLARFERGSGGTPGPTGRLPIGPIGRGFES